jgi:parvulin-like peptidyl-prolyl isomerase
MLYSIFGLPPRVKLFFMSPVFLRVLPLLAVVLALVIAAGCGGGNDDATGGGGSETTTTSSAIVPADAIALVGEEKVLRKDFDALLDQVAKSSEAEKTELPKPGTSEFETLKNQAVEFLVQRAEFRQEATALGVAITQKEVDGRLELLKEQYFGGDEEKYASELKKQGLTEAQLVSDVRAQLVSEKLFETVTKDVAVTDAEISKYYEDNEPQFTQPATREVRHILVKKEAKADELYEDIKGGADFAALAKEFSQDPGSKEQGGKLTIRRGETVPEFDKTAFDLGTGELAAPVKTEFGCHIIEALSAVTPKQVTPLDEAKTSIRSQLLEQQRNEAMSKWVDDLSAKYETKISYAVGYAPPPPAATATGSAGTGEDEQSGATTQPE